MQAWMDACPQARASGMCQQPGYMVAHWCLASRKVLSGFPFSMEKSKSEVKYATDTGPGFQTQFLEAPDGWRRMRIRPAKTLAGKSLFFLKIVLLVTVTRFMLRPVPHRSLLTLHACTLLSQCPFTSNTQHLCFGRTALKLRQGSHSLYLCR